MTTTPKDHSYKVAVGDGFSGDVWLVTAPDVNAASVQAMDRIKSEKLADWRVINVRQV